MNATSTTFAPPATVTIPGTAALEAAALLDAYANVAADFRLDGEPEPFFQIEDPLWRVLLTAAGHGPEQDLEGPVWEAINARSAVLQDAIRSHFDGPALGAIATTRMAGDIAEVKAYMKYSPRSKAASGSAAGSR